jgi:hypothetical protein
MIGRILVGVAVIAAVVGSPTLGAAQKLEGEAGASVSGAGTAPASSLWGAIAFTADGSWVTAWKKPSKAEAEATVAVDCAKFGRGACEVVSFPGTMCVGLASYSGSHSGRRYRLSFTSGAGTTPEAQKAAVDRCNADSRTRKRCQLRTVVCGDGR